MKTTFLIFFFRDTYMGTQEDKAYLIASYSFKETEK